ncbi:MAG: DUF4954 family protein [Planctomycetota bacterium]|nr:DUF4954 family protein [Planctomycetota bacterium]
MPLDAKAAAPPAEAVRLAIRDSELLKGLAARRGLTPQSRNLRPLTPEEIAALKAQHNAAEDWTQVWVARDFNAHKVVGCYFCGQVLLGVYSQQVTLGPSLKVGSGVYNCTLNNVSVGDNAYLANTALIANYHVGPGAVVQGCGRIACLSETKFGNGQKVSLGLEIPGRDTAFYAEINVAVAAQVAAYRQTTAFLPAYEKAVADYAALATAGFGVIEAEAMVQNTPRILNTFIGAAAVIDAAGSIEEATILSSPDEPALISTGACIKNAIVQWGCRVETHAIVEQSVCCEHSSVENHGRLTRSLLGPNSVVSSGECLHSLVGPFVGFHHQSLLVAAYWPEGKGTVAYGANVGAEHTGKQPDQEIWPGEGQFFALGANVRFPADYSKAPYSVIGLGVSTPPQRVEMPFSLIRPPSQRFEGVAPAYNEIQPGWVLSENIYVVRRNERKYAIRNKARRAHYDFEIFRPEIVDLMLRARASLRSVEAPGEAQTREFYTDRHIPALGRNFMKERARLEGIAAYTFYIRMYALKGLLFGVKFCLQQKRDAGRVLEAGYIVDSRYEHERALLVSEFPGKNVKDLLQELVAAHEKMAADMLLAKEKDDFRGVRIVPDYMMVHVPAKDDPFVRVTQHETGELEAEVAELLRQL